MNFTRPTESTPALLTYDEVETFLHEFGHALHGLTANSRYESLSVPYTQLTLPTSELV